MIDPSAPGWTVFVPVKSLDRAKSRLATLPAHDRRALVLAFALDVVAAALAVDSVEQVVAVADDDLVRTRCVELGARGARPAAGGLNEVLAHAASDLAPDTPVAVVVADLPALRPQDLQEALRLARKWPRSFVSDTQGMGTTFLAAHTGERLDPRFGTRSRAQHAASGAVELTDRSLARLRCDVDTEVDLRHAQYLGLGPRTAASLDRPATDGPQTR